MKRFILYSFLFVAFAITVVGCNLEQEIDIDLPDYESRYVVECYLEPGQPFTLLLTRTASYFDPFPTSNNDFLDQILVDGATVTIEHNGQTYALQNGLFFNPLSRKAYNYLAPEFIPEDYERDFELNIVTPDGKTITATTRILRPIPIDSIVVEFLEDDTLARVLTYLKDVPNEQNYIRRMLHEHSLDSIPLQDFATDDRFVEDNIVFGSAYNFAAGDTVFNTIFHIDRPYYDFFNSVQTAAASNGNPFGQPSPIISNLRGTANAIGIFTGLSYDRIMTIVER
ncbi:MAG: DUF4249 domain-containing protein [Saprospiraceae bacterium]|nr:DUF4249 domain-containing protein [Saprospiraceae bacterium]